MHDPEVWRVATFNIWNRPGPWDKRLPLIREGLAAPGADVIGLQGQSVYFADCWAVAASEPLRAARA
jgi:hypothetical protein